MIKLNYSKLEVNLVESDNWKSIISDAWCTSRPNVSRDEIDLKEVISIDTPVSEMAGCVLHFKVPILFRDIICTMRDHIIWARTSRVDNLTEEWLLIDQLDQDTQSSITELANKLSKESKTLHQDLFRYNLPLSYITEFTARFSLRSLIKLYLYFKSLINNDELLSIRSQCLTLVSEIESVLNTLDIPQEALSRIKPYDICPPINNSSSGRSGDFLTITSEMPFSLRAQLVRHRVIFIKDNLIEKCKSSDIWSEPLSTLVNVQVSGSVEVFSKIVEKRNCWLAQADLWSPLVKEINSYIGGSFNIPCKNGICPYEGDCKKRVEGQDPGLSCPRHLKLSKIRDSKFDKDYRDSCKKYVSESCRPEDYWFSEIDDSSNV